MILDIEQNRYSDTVKISYIDSDRNRQILSVKKRDFWKWRYYDGPNADIKYKSWDNKRVVRISYKDTDTVDKKSIWDIKTYCMNSIYLRCYFAILKPIFMMVSQM